MLIVGIIVCSSCVVKGPLLSTGSAVQKTPLIDLAHDMILMQVKKEFILGLL